MAALAQRLYGRHIIALKAEIQSLESEFLITHKELDEIERGEWDAKFQAQLDVPSQPTEALTETKTPMKTTEVIDEVTPGTKRTRTGRKKASASSTPAPMEDDGVQHKEKDEPPAKRSRRDTETPMEIYAKESEAESPAFNAAATRDGRNTKEASADDGTASFANVEEDEGEGRNKNADEKEKEELLQQAVEEDTLGLVEDETASTQLDTDIVKEPESTSPVDNETQDQGEMNSGEEEAIISVPERETTSHLAEEDLSEHEEEEPEEPLDLDAPESVTGEVTDGAESASLSAKAEVSSPESDGISLPRFLTILIAASRKYAYEAQAKTFLNDNPSTARSAFLTSFSNSLFTAYPRLRCPRLP